MAASASACTFFRFRSLFATFFANSHGVAFRRFLCLKSLAPRVRPCPFPRPFPMPGKYQRLPTAGRDTPPPSTCIAPQSMRTHISVTSVFCRTCSQNANEYSTERFHRVWALLVRYAGPGRTERFRSARALLARDAGPGRTERFRSARALLGKRTRKVTVTRCSAAALTGQGMQTVTHKHTAVPPPCGANVTQTVALQTCTAQSTLPPSASVARDAGRTERFRSARALLARDAVLCDSSSRAHGPWLTEAHAHRVSRH